MLRRTPQFRSVVAMLIAGLVMTACSDGDASDDEPIEPIVTQPLATDGPDDTLVEDSAPDPGTTEPDQPTATSTATSAPDVATTTSAAPSTTVATTTTPPTTTTTIAESIAIQELILSEVGLGSTRFGADPDGVITYVTSILGSPTDDTEWVDPFTFADCSFANEARRVDWGVLSVIFTDVSVYASGRPHFIGWEYGLVGGLGDEPQGLRTAGGITLGSRLVDLVTEFPDVIITEGDEDVAIPAGYYLNDDFNGLLTGTADTDVITVMTGGIGCFSG